MQTVRESRAILVTTARSPMRPDLPLVRRITREPGVRGTLLCESGAGGTGAEGSESAESTGIAIGREEERDAIPCRGTVVEREELQEDQSRLQT